jgi:biopolymer transport protein ExbD
MDTELLHVTDKGVPVYYRIDKDVRYEEIVKVLELLKKHRFENIVLITEAKS